MQHIKPIDPVSKLVSAAKPELALFSAGQTRSSIAFELRNHNSISSQLQGRYHPATDAFACSSTSRVSSSCPPVYSGKEAKIMPQNVLAAAATTSSLADALKVE